jgi:murein DD-endopeptidase MepM/ murein hydrolase activator NlpD
MIQLKNTFKDWIITQYFGKTLFAQKHPNYYPLYGQHTGIDFGMKKGTPIKAPHNGVVVKINTERRYNPKTGREIGTGLSLSLWDPIQEIATRYYHLDQILVSNNQKIEAGDIIGHVGNTGLSDGDHLHFELLETYNGYVKNMSNGAGGAIDPFGDNINWI